MDEDDGPYTQCAACGAVIAVDPEWDFSDDTPLCTDCADELEAEGEDD